MSGQVTDERRWFPPGEWERICAMTPEEKAAALDALRKLRGGS